MENYRIFSPRAMGLSRISSSQKDVQNMANQSKECVSQSMEVQEGSMSSVDARN
jgi:hypothetical protein